MIPADAARKTRVVNVSGNPLVEILRATDPFRKSGLLEGVSFGRAVVSAVKRHQAIFTVLSVCLLPLLCKLFPIPSGRSATADRWQFKALLLV